MKLNFLSGSQPKEGFINLDAHQYKGKTDVVFYVDCKEPLPFKDNTFEYIIADNALEHITDKIWIMNELYRILQPDGVLEAIIPSTESMGAFQDPTHVSFWNYNSMAYFCVENNLYWQYKDAYKITCAFTVLDYQRIEINSKGWYGYGNEHKMVFDKWILKK